MADAVCAVDNCDRPKRLAGLCGAHHQRKLRYGDVRAHIPLRGKPLPDGLVWCSACERKQEPANFHRNRATLTGYDGVCRSCVHARWERQKSRRAAVRRAYVDRNREKINARKRADYQRVDKQRRLAISRAWRAANPERVREQIRAQNQARYARLKAAPGQATTEQINARWNYYGGKCWMCGTEATDIDHVKPLAAGGCNWPANLRPACRSCNRSKSAQWPYALEGARGRRAA